MTNTWFQGFLNPTTKTIENIRNTIKRKEICDEDTPLVALIVNPKINPIPGPAKGLRYHRTVEDSRKTDPPFFKPFTSKDKTSPTKHSKTSQKTQKSKKNQKNPKKQKKTKNSKKNKTPGSLVNSFSCFVILMEMPMSIKVTSGELSALRGKRCGGLRWVFDVFVCRSMFSLASSSKVFSLCWSSFLGRTACAFNCGVVATHGSLSFCWKDSGRSCTLSSGPSWSRLPFSSWTPDLEGL